VGAETVISGIVHRGPGAALARADEAHCRPGGRPFRRRRGRRRVAAFVCSALGVPLAAGVLSPFTGWLLSPMSAAAAMSLSSISIIFNALRLHRRATSTATGPAPRE
jgi:hypothetical protein